MKNTPMKTPSLPLLLAALGVILPLASAPGQYEAMPSLNGGAYSHQAAVIEDTIYVIARKGSVTRSTVDEAGALSAWKFQDIGGELFPAGMGGKYSCSAASGDWVYIMGGLVNTVEMGNTNPSAMVVKAQRNPDGRLDPWQETTPLPEPRYDGAAVVADGYLYHVGGEGHRKVFSAKILENGDLGAWTETQPLPTNRYGMHVFASGGYLYVVGGFVLHLRPTDTVFRAKILPGGTLEKWTKTEPLPGTRADYGGVVADGKIYLFGGDIGDIGDGNQQSASALVGPIGADGHIAAWSEIPPLPEAARGLQAVVARDHIFLIGGIFLQEGGNTVYKTVWRFPLPAKGERE